MEIYHDVFAFCSFPFCVFHGENLYFFRHNDCNVDENVCYGGNPHDVNNSGGTPDLLVRGGTPHGVNNVLPIPDRELDVDPVLRRRVDEHHGARIPHTPDVLAVLDLPGGLLRRTLVPVGPSDRGDPWLRSHDDLVPILSNQTLPQNPALLNCASSSATTDAAC